MSQRFKNIDVLRGVAVLLVFATHNMAHSAHFPWLLNPVLDFLHCGGWVGVDLFFVLSGFLIANLLFSEYNHHGGIDVVRFFIRRGFKIYPCYYLMIGLTLFILIFFKISFSAMTTLPFLVFVQNYIYVAPKAFDVFQMWGHTWSLATEEHFYLTLPPLLMVLIAKTKQGENPFCKIPLIFLFIAFSCFGLRFAKSCVMPFSFMGFTAASHLRADSLFFGVLMAYYYTYRRDDFERVFRFIHPSVVACVGVLFLLPAFMFAAESTRFIYTAGFSLFYLGSGLVLAAALVMDFKGNWVLDGLRFIGRYSYPIYLWHMPLKVVSEYQNRFYPSGVLYFMTYFIAPLVLGVVMSKSVETPLLRLRDKVVPSRSV